MLLEIFMAIFIGIGLGVITGLFPGIHVNLVSIMVINFSLVLTKAFSPLTIAVFLISLGITHTFLDFIPSVFLGAPEESTALIILPSHKMLMQGHGQYAVLLATAGAVFSIILLIIFSPLIYVIAKFLFGQINLAIRYILLFLVFFLILRNHGLKQKIWAGIVFFLSGILGVIVLNSSVFTNPLHPLLSGLFGLSVILYSLSSKSKIPEQAECEYKFRIPKLGLIGSCIGGIITGIFPGITTSIAAIFGKLIFRNMDDHDYITLVGGAGTANFIVSLFIFYIAGKTRNGIVVGIKEILGEITFMHILLFISVCLVASGIAAFLTIFISRLFARTLGRWNYNLISIIVALLIVGTVFAFSGWIGVIILVVSTAIGMLPHYTGVGNNNCMGCLLLPVLFNFFF